MLDYELCVAIGIADAEPAQSRLDDSQQVAFVAAMSAEAVVWLERLAAVLFIRRIIFGRA